MAENPNDSSGDSQKAPSGAAGQNGSKAVSSNLPMVLAPKLGAGEDETIDAEAAGAAAADQAAAPAARAQASRFLMLAASVACAAAFGSFVGAASGSGLARYLDPPAPVTGVAATTDTMRDMKLELSELSAIKANLETASRSTTSQFAKLTDRLDGLDRRASAAIETTGSIAAPAPAPSPQPAAAAPKLTDRILPDWVVQDVQGGRALVESRYGGMFDVGEGSMLPGVGRVDQIKRQDGQWLVLTERGTITSGR